MKNILVILSIILFFSCSTIKTDNKLADRIDKYMQGKVEFSNFSGAILVAKNDSIILQKGYGLADREWNIANTSDTKFRIGSNTKQFTATAILQLADQGKLSLNDKLSKYFKGFEYGDTVTIQMLLTHSSGIQDYYNFEMFSKLKPLSISKDSMVGMFKKHLFDYLPGTDIVYSNSGYFLLGLIIEKVSGQSYEDYITQHIFKIAGMKNTGINKYDTILSKRAKGYQISATGTTNAFDENYRIGTLFAVGSIYSTVEDIYKYDRALYGNSILNESSKKKMFYPYGYGISQEKRKQDPSNTSPQNMDPIWLHLGYGVWVDTFLTHKRIFTRGFVLGFKSTIYRFVDDNICIVVLQNNEEIPDAVAEPLAAIVFGNEVAIPYKHKPYKIDPEVLKKYTGRWIGEINGEKWIMETIIADNKFYRRIEGSPDMELIAESDTKFFYSDGQDKVFDFTESGTKEIIQSWFVMNGMKYRLDKMKNY
jgi:CubicO group peptidase (beta-lactamase class C family)